VRLRGWQERRGENLAPPPRRPRAAMGMNVGSTLVSGRLGAPPLVVRGRRRATSRRKSGKRPRAVFQACYSRHHSGVRPRVAIQSCDLAPPFRHETSRHPQQPTPPACSRSMCTRARARAQKKRAARRRPPTAKWKLCRKRYCTCFNFYNDWISWNFDGLLIDDSDLRTSAKMTLDQQEKNV